MTQYFAFTIPTKTGDVACALRRRGLVTIFSSTGSEYDLSDNPEESLPTLVSWLMSGAITEVTPRQLGELLVQERIIADELHHGRTKNMGLDL